MDYVLLGVTPETSFQEIKSSWRELCKKYHPDNPVTGDESKFKKINEAYKRITDKINSHTVPNEEREEVDYKGLLDDYIKYAFIKYVDIYVIVGYLENYLNGNERGITRDNNYRDLFLKHLSSDTIKSIIGGNTFQYIVSIVQDYDPSYDVFIQACKATYIKYGRNQLVSALDEAINGNFSRFTNDGKGLRDNMYKFVNANNIMNYLTEMVGYENLDPNISIGEQSVDVLLFNMFRKNQGRGTR